MAKWVEELDVFANPWWDGLNKWPKNGSFWCQDSLPGGRLKKDVYF